MESSVHTTGDGDSGLVDVTRLPLAELLLSRDPALTAALRRLLADLDHTGLDHLPGRLAPFNNYL